MNLNRYHIILFLLSSMSFWACEKELHVHIDQENKLVLNSILKVDQPIKIELSKTGNILNSKDNVDWVRNADVYLTYGDNQFQEKLEYDSLGVYSSKHVGAFGEVYEVEIVHNVFKNVSAKAKMPDATEGYVRYYESSELDSENAYFEIQIPNKLEGNFYIWEMFRKEDVSGRSINLTSLDQNTDNILPDDTQVRNRIFIKGDRTESTQLNSSFIADDIKEEDLPTLKVRLLTVNEDMYNYYKSLELYKNALTNYIEPIEIYSNIENGLGIFGAISETIMTIDR